MRVLYLHQYFVTPAMSGGTRSYEMARRLVEAGHRVDLITSDQSRARGPGWRVSDEDGITVHWAPVPYDNRMGRLRRIGAFLSFALRASWRAVRLDADVIFATSTPLTIAIPAMIASAVRRRPFVFEVRDQWPDVPIAIGAIRQPVAIFLARALELLTYRRAAHVVALAPGMRADIVAKGVPANKVSVVPNGCDFGLFAVDEGARDRLRGANAWLGDRPLVVFAGAFGEVNDVGWLVRLAARVRSLDPEVRFALFGAGRDLPLVRQLAKDLGVGGESVFFFDPLPKAKLAEWLAASDMCMALFTGPRVIWKDAVQNKFFDALAAGIPIACNFDGWQTRIAAAYDVGIHLPPADLDGAARTLVSRLSDRRWLGSARSRALALGKARFDRELLARDLRVILEQVAATGRADALGPDE